MSFDLEVDSLYSYHDFKALFSGDALLLSSADGELFKFRCFSEGYFCFCKDPCRPREYDFYIWFSTLESLLDAGVYEIYFYGID